MARVPWPSSAEQYSSRDQFRPRFMQLLLTPLPGKLEDVELETWRRILEEVPEAAFALPASALLENHLAQLVINKGTEGRDLRKLFYEFLVQTLFERAQIRDEQGLAKTLARQAVLSAGIPIQQPKREHVVMLSFHLDCISSEQHSANTEVVLRQPREEDRCLLQAALYLGLFGNGWCELRPSVVDPGSSDMVLGLYADDSEQLTLGVTPLINIINGLVARGSLSPAHSMLCGTAISLDSSAQDALDLIAHTREQESRLFPDSGGSIMSNELKQLQTWIINNKKLPSADDAKALPAPNRNCGFYEPNRFSGSSQALGVKIINFAILLELLRTDSKRRMEGADLSAEMLPVPVFP